MLIQCHTKLYFLLRSNLLKFYGIFTIAIFNYLVLIFRLLVDQRR